MGDVPADAPVRFRQAAPHQKKNEEGENKVESIRVHPETIPDYIWSGLASGTLALYREIVSSPAGWEALAKKKAELWPDRYAKKE